MKKLLILLLLALSVSANAQNKKKLFYLLSQQAATIEKTYVAKPTPPAFSGSEGVDFKLLDVSMGSSITQAELTGSIKKGLVPNPYTNMLRASQLVGTEGAPFIFKSADDNVYSVVGGATLLTGSTVFDQTGATISDWMEFHHLKGLGHNGVASLTGAGWTGKAGGSNLLLSDIILESTQSPGVQFNGDGDAGTFGNMRMHFIRVHGDNTDNECFYFGDTSTTGFGIVNTLTATHLFGYNKGWDGLQINSTQNVNVSNVTIYDVGKSATSGQKSLLQAQNLGDGAIIENFLFHTAPKAFQIAGRSMWLRNGVFISDEEGFAQSMAQAGYTGGDILSTADGDIIFENIYFDSTTPRTYAVNVNEPDASYYFVNCTIDGDITNLFQNNTGGSDVYEYNTTTGAANLPTPTFASTDPDNELAGCITNDYYYDRGIGFRTPPITINRPTITSFDPSTGTTDDVITITGTNFTGATHVTIGNTAAASFVVNSATEIEATVAVGTTGKIRVITPSGYSVSSTDFTFTAPFNPYTDITWVAAFDPTDYDGGAGTWNNQGTGADAAQGGATIYPSKLSSLSTKSTYGLSFVNASGTGLQYGTGTVTEPFETWIEIITPASFSGTQRIYANGNAARVTINASGQISVGGNGDVSTGLTLSTSTRYVLRIVNDGANSSITANNGTPLTFTITAQNGSSTPKLGHAYSAGSGHWTGTLGAFFQKSTALSGGEVTSMWDWFGL